MFGLGLATLEEVCSCRVCAANSDGPNTLRTRGSFCSGIARNDNNGAQCELSYFVCKMKRHH